MRSPQKVASDLRVCAGSRQRADPVTNKRSEISTQELPAWPSAKNQKDRGSNAGSNEASAAISPARACSLTSRFLRAICSSATVLMLLQDSRVVCNNLLSVNPVSTLTGNTGDTVMPHAATAMSYGKIETGSTVSVTAFGVCTGAASGSVVRLYNIATLTRILDTTGLTNCAGLVFSDPLKIFITNSGNNNKKMILLQVSAAIFTEKTAQSKSITTGEIIQRITQGTASTLVTGASKGKIVNFDLTKNNANAGNLIEQTPVNLAETAANVAGLFDNLVDAFIVAKEATSILIVRRSDFVGIKNLALTAVPGTTSYYALNNLNTNVLYGFNANKKVYILDLSGASPATKLAEPDLTTYGSPNSLMNMGTMLYLATIPSASATSRLVLINKSTYQVHTTLFTLTSSANAVANNFIGFEASADRMYFALVSGVLPNQNIQSYYLLVDNCTSRVNDICQTCPAGTYKTNLTAGNECWNTSIFLNFTGIKSSDQSIANCTDALCLDCVQNYAFCSICPTESLSVNGVCIAISGYGASGNGKSLKQCQTAYCDKCPDNFQICTQCYQGATLLNNVCSFPPGHTWDTSKGSLVKCESPGCLDCGQNFKQCLACMVGTTASGGKCTTVAGYGTNTTTNLVQRCTFIGCTDCFADYQVCTTCITGSTLTALACDPSPGYGYDNSSFTIKRCSSIGCVDCELDFSICLDCVAGSNLVADACQPIPGYGINTAGYTISPCTATYCINCNLDFQVCTACTTYATLASATSCTVNPGYGLNTTSQQLQRCTSIGCTSCAANNLICTACVTGSQLTNDACQPLPGYGTNTPAYTISPCSDTYCAACVADYQVCTVCETGSSLTPGPSCSILPGFGPNTQGTLVVCSQIGCLNCSVSFDTCISCPVGTTLNAGSCTVLPGYGINQAQNTISPCSVSWCKECFADFQVCQVCQDHSTLQTNTCVISSGFGPNPNLLTACASIGCTDCSGNYSICTACVSDAILTDTVCTPKTGFGVSTSTKQILPCQTPSCQNCASDYTVCDSCPVGSTSSGGGSCVPNPGYGFDSTMSNILQCTTAGCLDCKNNYQVCIQCQTNSVLTAGSCIPNQGYGENQATNLYEQCTAVGCALCVSNFQECTQCLPVATFDPLTKACIPKPGFGLNALLNQIQACSVSNCIDCSADYSTCVKCDTNFALQSNTCVSTTGTVGFGLNPSIGGLAPCAISFCQLCSQNYEVCVGCPAGTTLTNNLCQVNLGFGLVTNSASVQFSQCQSPDCLDCLENNLECKACGQNSQLNPTTNACEPLVGFGLDSTTSAFKPCSSTSCVDCAADFSVCSTCAQGSTKVGSTCTVESGFGVDPATRALTPGLDGTCSAGQADFSKCVQCASGYQSVDSACSAISGFGLDSTDASIKPCASEGCMNCTNNYQICTECDTSRGYILQDGSCARQTTPVYFTATVNPNRRAAVDISFTLMPATSGIVHLSEILTFLKNSGKISFALVDSQGTYLYPKHSLTISSTDSSLTIDITLEQSVSSSGTSTLTVNETLFATFADQAYEIYVYEGSSDFDSLEGPGTSIEQTGAMQIGSFSAQSVDTSDNIVFVALGTVMAADPTGTFFRFTKILQIVNKLYFININYGKRLEAFLAKSATFMKHDSSQDGNKPQHVYNSRTYRGKLSKTKTELNFPAFMTIRLILYFISWGLKGLKRFLINNCLMGKIGIYFCHYANKVHLIIFNLVFIDFIWLAPRTLMHSQYLPSSNILLTMMAVILLIADMYIILLHMLNDKVWMRAYQHYSRIKRRLQPAKKEDPVSEKPTNTIENDKKSSIIRSSSSGYVSSRSLRPNGNPDQPQPQVIDYQRTYEEIEFNIHLMDIATAQLRLDKSVYQSLLCRILVSLLWFRIPLIEVLIVSCQYTNLLCISILGSVELLRMYATIYAYLKYKYLKNLICLLMEVSQAIFMSFFLYMMLLISPKRFDESITDFYQDAGIWIVILSCVAEYLLLLTYIGVAAYEFFKNRRIMKKNNLQQEKYQLIKMEDNVMDDCSESARCINSTNKQKTDNNNSSPPKEESAEFENPSQIRKKKSSEEDENLFAPEVEINPNSPDQQKEKSKTLLQKVTLMLKVRSKGLTSGAGNSWKTDPPGNNGSIL